jgi:hypothetical protein
VGVEQSGMKHFQASIYDKNYKIISKQNNNTIWEK